MSGQFPFVVFLSNALYKKKMYSYYQNYSHRIRYFISTVLQTYNKEEQETRLQYTVLCLSFRAKCPLFIPGPFHSENSNSQGIPNKSINIRNVQSLNVPSLNIPSLNVPSLKVPLLNYPITKRPNHYIVHPVVFNE